MSLKILSLKKDAKPFAIRSKSKTQAEIIIYDQIGYDWWTGGGITAQSFSDELKALDPAVTELVVRINSPGGDVFDGIAIYNRLVQHKAKKTVYIDGLAASIASIIALAGDEVIIGEGALYMIHLPWTVAMGNRMDLDNTVNRLMDVEEQLISIYAKKTKLDRSEIRSMLEKETWMGSKDAIEKGFVDKTFDSENAIAASALDKRWMARAPTKNVRTEEAVIRQGLEDLKNKIGGKLARK